ncbi:MAG: hypothetical protein QXW70_02735 [Candidatus Anstonellales archaeon]
MQKANKPMQEAEFFDRLMEETKILEQKGRSLVAGQPSRYVIRKVNSTDPEGLFKKTAKEIERIVK